MPLRTSTLLIGVLVVGASPVKSHAEMILDFHLGAAFTFADELVFKDRDPNENQFGEDTIEAKDNTSFNPSLALGARVGYYFESVPILGIAGDLSYFEAEGGHIQKNRIFPLTAFLLLRAPLLQDEDYEHGRLQPYVGLGPTIFIQDVEIERFGGVSKDLSTVSVDVGATFAAGVSFQIRPGIAVFAEYRLSYFKQKVSDREPISYGSSSADRLSEVDLFTNLVLFGVSFRF